MYVRIAKVDELGTAMLGTYRYYGYYLKIPVVYDENQEVATRERTIDVDGFSNTLKVSQGTVEGTRTFRNSSFRNSLEDACAVCKITGVVCSGTGYGTTSLTVEPHSPRRTRLAIYLDAIPTNDLRDMLTYPENTRNRDIPTCVPVASPYQIIIKEQKCYAILGNKCIWFPYNSINTSRLSAQDLYQLLMNIVICAMFGHSYIALEEFLGTKEEVQACIPVILDRVIQGDILQSISFTDERMIVKAGDLYINTVAQKILPVLATHQDDNIKKFHEQIQEQIKLLSAEPWVESITADREILFVNTKTVENVQGTYIGRYTFSLSRGILLVKRTTGEMQGLRLVNAANAQRSSYSGWSSQTKTVYLGSSTTDVAKLIGRFRYLDAFKMIYRYIQAKGGIY